MREPHLGGDEASAFNADPERFVDDARAEFDRQLQSFQDAMEPGTVAAIRAKFEEYLSAYIDALQERRQAGEEPGRPGNLAALRAVRILGDHG